MKRIVRTGMRRTGNQVAAARLQAAAALQGIRLDLQIDPRAKVSPNVIPAFWGEGGSATIRIAAGAIVERGVIFRVNDGARIDIGPNVTLRTGVALNVSGHLEFQGNNVVTWYSTIHCAERVLFKEYAGVSEHVTVVDSTHFRGEDPEDFGYNNYVSAPVTIGRHSWLAGKTTVLYDTTVGDFAVISAGSVVMKSIPDWALAGGAPARVIRENFTGVGARERKAAKTAASADGSTPVGVTTAAPAPEAAPGTE